MIYMVTKVFFSSKDLHKIILNMATLHYIHIEVVKCEALWMHIADLWVFLWSWTMTADIEHFNLKAIVTFKIK